MPRPTAETLVFTTIAAISLPTALHLCHRGLRGTLLDTTPRDNMLAGLALLLLLGLIPTLLALASHACDTRRANRHGFEIHPRADRPTRKH